MKKFPFLFELVITTSLICLFLIYVNLERYGTYYATKLPHAKGTHPEITFTLSNLMHNTHPDDASLAYDYDGLNAIFKNQHYVLKGNGSFATLYFLDRSEKNEVHHFSNTGKYITTTQHFSTEGKATPEKQDEAYRLAYEAIQPILDVQEAPPNWQNLQWLFNLIYWWQFNIDWFENDQIH